MISYDCGLNSTDCIRVKVDYHQNGHCLPPPQTTGAGETAVTRKSQVLLFPSPAPNDVPREIRYWRQKTGGRGQTNVIKDRQEVQRNGGKEGDCEKFSCGLLKGFPFTLSRQKDWSNSSSWSLLSSTSAPSCWSIQAVRRKIIYRCRESVKRRHMQMYSLNKDINFRLLFLQG